ncbi:MAG: response regulator [Bacteroidetes bacterium]|nr:response regulator [Bacteroidota bacterium]
MKTPLRVLIVEDSEDDRELLLMKLRQGNYEPQFSQVETKEDLLNAFKQQRWDIVLSDYSMPMFDGISALRTVRELDPDIPFIIISGNIGEEVAVMAMKSGAQDYIMKGNLQRLIPAIERELKEAEHRRQKREAIEAKETSEKRFRNVFEHSVDAIGVSKDGIHIMVNPAYVKLFSYETSDEIAGIPVQDLIAPGERGKVHDYIVKRAKRENVPSGYETLGLRKDGTSFEMDVHVSTYEMNGDIFTMVILRDITESKRAAREILEAKNKAEALNRMKSNFLANMNHELRTPLNGILGYSEILISTLDDPDLVSMSQGIYDSGKRLSETLNFILDLSEAEAENLAVFAKDVNIVDLVRHSLDDFIPEIEKKNLKLDTVVHNEQLFSRVDERLLNRILYNLVDNAIKFTERGNVGIEIGKEEIEGKGWVYLKVKDSGIGIEKSNFDLIWEEFRQVSEGKSRYYQGTGLGLTITKRTVELMDGVISVESEVGEGSVFTVKFPETPPDADREEEIAPGVTTETPNRVFSGKQGQRPVALYVEDDPINLDVMGLFLRKICDVEMAETGEKAIEMIKSKKYDIFLLDINLGTGMNGMDVVKEIKKLPEYQGVPVVAVTAYAMGNDKADFLRGGCTHYLSKPYRKAEVVEIVENALK